MSARVGSGIGGLVAAGALLIAVTSCGTGTAPATSPRPAATSPSPQSTPAATPTTPATPSPPPTAATTPSPTASPAPVTVAVAAMWQVGHDSQLALVATDGRILGSTTLTGSAVGPGVPPTVAPDGVAYADRGHLRELTLSGRVVDLGLLPANLGTGSFAVSPDGRSIAYGTQTPAAALAGTSWHNQLWVDRLGSPPRLLADRLVSDSIVPRDAPQFWFYEVEKWTPQGILIGRLPQGIGGNGAYLSEGYRAYTALVDPATGASRSVTADRSCPLSQLAADGTAICFRWGPAPSLVTGIVMRGPDGTVRTWSMSGTNRAGDARFDARLGLLAYSTFPSSAYNDTLWEPHTVLRLLDVASGRAVQLGGDGLEPLALLPDGDILAVRHVRTASGSNDLTASLVVVDRQSGLVHTLRTLATSYPWIIGTVDAPAAR